MTNRDINVRTSPHRRGAAALLTARFSYNSANGKLGPVCVWEWLPAERCFASACRFAESNNSRHLIPMSDGRGHTSSGVRILHGAIVPLEDNGCAWLRLILYVYLFLFYPCLMTAPFTQSRVCIILPI